MLGSLSLYCSLSDRTFSRPTSLSPSALALGEAQMVPAGLGNFYATAHVRTHDPEGVVEHVEQAGVVGIPVVLGVELPVVGQHLAVIADDPQRLDEHAIDISGKPGADIVEERRRLAGERSEDQPAIDLHPQPFEPVAGLVEIRRKPALAADPALERDTSELAGEIVGPVVIDAAELPDVAGLLVADERALMRAAVD